MQAGSGLTFCLGTSWPACRRARLQAQWPQIVLIHKPIHASWLNQIEIYFWPLWCAMDIVNAN